MGGGWSKRGSGVPLAQRTRPDPAAHPAQPASVVPNETCPARHCWVSEAADERGAKRPGLLVEWRAASAGWEGRVVYAAQLRPAGWCLVEEWVPAERLTPA